MQRGDFLGDREDKEERRVKKEPSRALGQPKKCGQGNSPDPLARPPHGPSRWLCSWWMQETP